MGTLPKNWENVTGLYLSNGDDAYLKTLGWLPLVETNVTLSANQIFDTDVVTVEEDKVLLTHRARDMTAQEISDRDESNMASLREERNQKLLDSDWTQAPDHSSPLTDAEKAEWATYRQSLRNLPVTVDISLWPDVWPTEP
tara:strand:+ start:235 stop:657 length:423 start_codon:yes stop_codon:yes gene_type:complete